MIKPKILIAEDDQKIADLFIDYFNRENWETEHISNGKQTLELFNKVNFDLVILDLMLPKIDGIQVCKEIRKKSSVPILMITAKDQESDKIAGLTIGADDYITKPFSIHEVIARIKVQLRRIKTTSSQNPLLHREIELSVDQHQVKINSVEIDLTLIEFDLLKYFLERVGEIITKQQLLRDVWQQEIILDDNTVMVHIRRLRKKIEKNPDEPNYIKTIWGLGYRLE